MTIDVWTIPCDQFQGHTYAPCEKCGWNYADHPRYLTHAYTITDGTTAEKILRGGNNDI